MRALVPHSFLPQAPPQGGAPAPASFVHLLKGHSGAQVTLHTKGRTSLVRKTAGTVDQNDRLMRQSAHQRKLSACGLRFPRILREGQNEHGHAFFEMEYIPARSLAAILCEAAPFDAPQTIKALEQALGFFRITAGADHPEQVFHAKLDQIGAAAPRAAVIIARLRAMDWRGIPCSLSHGDMTLENILHCPSRGVVFIDCDDGFAPSWWLDAAKLCQDALGHWCMRDMYLNAPGGAGWLNARQRLDRMAVAVGGIAARLEPLLAARLPQLTALHLLRTLPYTRDEKLTGFVLDRSAHILDTAS